MHKKTIKPVNSLDMAWSKITNNCKKPWQWYMHKLFCEWGWIVRFKDNHKTYYHHLDMCCKYGFNLYGEPVKGTDTEPQHDVKLPVICGFCRDCKFAKPDFEFEQLIICENPNLKLSAVFTMEGCQFSVEPDFGCVQFENRT